MDETTAYVLIGVFSAWIGGCFGYVFGYAAAAKRALRGLQEND